MYKHSYKVDSDGDQCKKALAKMISPEILNDVNNRSKITALANPRGILLVEKNGIDVFLKYDSAVLTALCSPSGKIAEEKFGAAIYSLEDYQLKFLCSTLGLDFVTRSGFDVLKTFTANDISEFKMDNIDWQKVRKINPNNLSSLLLYSIGNYFTQKLILSDNDKTELGVFFLKIIQKELIEFPQHIIAKLGDEMGSNKPDLSKGKKIADVIVSCMLQSSKLYGFHQLRILLGIAEQINPSIPPIKNTDMHIAKMLDRDNFVEAANFVFDRLTAADNHIRNQLQLMPSCQKQFST